mmetsp:Transcript_175001/g.425824  ORF Transcript_175001/g.425824 Transcript_175001/m.425824 type:complete len:83 (-) Transcript_175001:14-262(-)
MLANAARRRALCPAQLLLYPAAPSFQVCNHGMISARLGTRQALVFVIEVWKTCSGQAHAYVPNFRCEQHWRQWSIDLLIASA